MTLYRGYEITKDGAGFSWTDENGAKRTTGAKGEFRTEEHAMDDIDAYRRQIRDASQAA